MQIGVEAVDLVMVFKSEKGIQKMLLSKSEIGRDASVEWDPWDGILQKTLM